MTETPAAAAQTPDALADTDIAVVGMAAHFPDAPDLDRFWTNLVAGHESIRPLTATELFVDLSVKKLFENLTVAEVVREIESIRHAPAATTTKITPSRRRTTRR
jgi:Beta-ketoacyl synthase, N-terminal domain